MNVPTPNGGTMRIDTRLIVQAFGFFSVLGTLGILTMNIGAYKEGIDRTLAYHSNRLDALDKTVEKLTDASADQSRQQVRIEERIDGVFKMVDNMSRKIDRAIEGPKQ